METYQLALPMEPESDAAPILAVSIGRGGNTLFLGADPETGLITVAADGGVDLQLDGDNFDLIAELLLRALGN